MINPYLLLLYCGWLKVKCLGGSSLLALLSTMTSMFFPASLMIPTASSTVLGRMLLMVTTLSFSLRMRVK